MTIVLKPEQERVLAEAVRSGLAHSADEALDQALDALRDRISSETPADAGAAARRLGSFGKHHRLSLGELTIKDLLRESRP